MKAFILVLILISFTIHTISQCYDIYGLSATGGEYGAGAIIQFDENGNNKVVYSFYKIDTWLPKSHFCKAADGSLYALSNVLFQWDPETNLYSKKTKLNAYSSGSVIRGKDGKFYGMTRSISYIEVNAVLFEWDAITGIYTERYIFDYEYVTQGSLVQAENGLMYGLTSTGGSNNCGVLFEWDPESGKFAKLADLDFGARGSLCIAENGNLYGVGRSVVNFKDGVLFEYDLVTDTLIKRHVFDGIESGSHPESSLVLADNGKLYGTTVEGGVFGYGVLFEYHPDSNQFRKIIDFDSANFGKNPLAELTKMENGILVGVTRTSVFTFDPETITFAMKCSFKSLDLLPTSSLVQAGNGMYYGFSGTGGIPRFMEPPYYNDGVIYEWDPVADSCSIKLRFHDTFYGEWPKSLGYSNGKFYGTSSLNEYCSHGILFEFDPVNGKFHRITALSGSDMPGPLLKANNGKFYGWTRGDWECASHPILFEWDPITKEYTQKYILHNNGDIFRKGPVFTPNNQMIEGNNGKFYYGSGYNSLIEWDVERDTLICKYKYAFDPDTAGSNPVLLLSAKNGKLIGYNENGGSYNRGTLFEWDPVTNIFDKLLDLSFNTPVSSLFQLDSNRYFGAGNRGNLGVFFEWTQEEDSFKIIYQFDVNYNYNENLGEDMTLADNGKLYGTINSVDSGYYFFEWDPLNDSFKKLVEFEAPENNGIRFIDFEMIRHQKVNTITVASCNDLISPSGKYVWKESGVYYDTIFSSSGCDSIIAIDLTIYTVDISVTQDQSVLTALAVNSEYQWIDCSNGWTPIEGETAQTFISAVDGNYAVIITQNGCVDTSDCFEINLTGLLYSNFRQNIKLYPNPTDGKFKVDMGREIPDCEVSVIQPDGRVIAKQSIKNRQIFDLLITASPGYYMVTIRAGNEQAIFKVLKK